MGILMLYYEQLKQFNDELLKLLYNAATLEMLCRKEKIILPNQNEKYNITKEDILEISKSFPITFSLNALLTEAK